MTERADSPKNKFFGAMACLEPSLAEFSHSLYQCLQLGHFFRTLPLIFDQWWKEMLVQPLGHIIEVDVKPPLGGTFPAAPEGDL
jgi:hypothetical protein